LCCCCGVDDVVVCVVVVVAVVSGCVVADVDSSVDIGVVVGGGVIVSWW